MSSRQFTKLVSRLTTGVLVLAAATVALAVDIQPEYDPNITPEQKAVIEHKIQLWENRLPHQDPEHVVKIKFRNADLGGDYETAPGFVEPVWGGSVYGDHGESLGETDGFTHDAEGRPTGARITINNNANVKWYNGLGEEVPADQYDLYTVINHELMHALGFTVANPRFARNVDSQPSGGRTYEGGTPEGEPRGTLTPEGEGTHIDPGAHPGDLMNPELPTGTRRRPSALDIGILLDDVWAYPVIEGKLSNFDVWNRCGVIANDFQVTLGGLIKQSITDLYNGVFNPFSDGVVTQEGNKVKIKWGPGPGQVNPGQKAHFGFKIKGDITPLDFKFEWTQNNVVICDVPVNGTTWRRLADGISTRNRVRNTSERVIWVMRRINFSEEPIVLDDLLFGTPLEQSAMPVDPQPVPLLPGESLRFDFPQPFGLWGVVMIADLLEDNNGLPGMPLGTWFDAAQLVPSPGQIGDMNCDGEVDFGDINPFILALSNPAGYQQQFPDCDIMNGDINEDGLVDFGDINPFVTLLTNP